MLNYPLSDMLKVRKLRETTAISKLAQARSHVEKKTEKVSKKKDALTNYRNWREKKQQELFCTIEEKTLSYTELEYITLTIQWLRTGEKVFIQELEEAHKELEEARKEFEQAKKNYEKTQKDMFKLNLHKDIWNKEKQKQAERKAEDEIEESSQGGKHGFNF